MVVTDLADEVRLLRAELRNLRDHEAIRDQLGLYVQHLDSGQYAEIPEALFTEDAVYFRAQLESEPGILRGREAIRAFLESTMPTFAATQHLLGNIRVDVDGDFATSQASALCSYWLPDDTQPRSDLTVALVYVDAWIRFPAGWRIEERRVYTCGPQARIVGDVEALNLTRGAGHNEDACAKRKLPMPEPSGMQSAGRNERFGR